MRVLCACEESQVVATAFRKRGHEAFSCDILPCSGGHPEWHIQSDVTELLKEHWDMIIAVPPCTYITGASACRMYPVSGVISEERLSKAMEAKAFFMQFYEADCPRVAIENPRPLRVVEMPKETQRVQPYWFGHPYTKLTYLWLKGLPPLLPTDMVINGVVPFVNAGSYDASGNKRKKQGVKYSASERSKTFQGLALAMAEQWGEIC